jgi:hypothetical protein
VTGIVLDAGALIGFERVQREVVLVVMRALEHGDAVVVPAGVVAQVWRDGRTQARLARLLGSPTCEVVPLDDKQARAAGQLCGVSRTHDIADASVAMLARERQLPVATSDADDLLRLDPTLRIVPI